MFYRTMLAALLAAAPATAAQAADPIFVTDGGPTARVSYADLNLHSTAGRDHFARRIRQAANRLCESANVEAILTDPERGHCFLVAVSDGVRQMNAVAGL